MTGLFNAENFNELPFLLAKLASTLATMVQAGAEHSWRIMRHHCWSLEEVEARI